ncbi:hypothetical protein K435DRAFT_960934 [Dendrothele bispora CBS 962.96]|uniref:Family A G protein-coupled receptor-like protein n=1 Tax=Dendrothele bispora (strain CBS 962.96) TaxID=1314807 RepID=A0A4S8MSR5_DENBC|nr:hypothetical protein K435DRAFT_960934 [Dendrothele bispora CBS 962.96]
MSLSADDQQILPAIGRSTYQNTMGIVVESATWGSYALLFGFAVYIQISNGLRTARNKVILGVTCLLFGSSTVLLALNVAWAEIGVQKILMDNPTGSLVDKVDSSNASILRLGTPMEALFLLNMIVGDTVVIWRAYVIWSRKKLVVVLPVICLLASLGFAITDVVCLDASVGAIKSSIPTGERICTWSEPIAWALSLLTNMISTALIAIQAWRLRRDLKNVFDDCIPNKQTWRAIALLIESGFIYCVFWMCELILFFDIPRTSQAFYAWQFFASIGDQISGIYPTAIIVIVSLQHTLDDTIATSKNLAETQSRMLFNSVSGPTQNLSNSRNIEFPNSAGTELGRMNASTFTSNTANTEVENWDHEKASGTKLAV